MTKRKTRREIEIDRHLVEEWAPICAAFGIQRPEDDGATLFDIGGRILHDREVDALRMDARTQVFDDPILVAAFDTNWVRLVEILGTAGVQRVVQRVRPS